MRFPNSVFGACGGFLAVFLMVVSSQSLAGSGQADIGKHRQLPTIIHHPEGASKSPAVLLLHTSSGLKKSVKKYGEALADEGIVVYVPDFFKPYDLTPRTRRETWTTHHDNLREDFLAVIDAMKRDENVDPNKVYVVGFSNGGYWAALFAAEGAIAGGVSYYGALSGGGEDVDQERLRERFNANSTPLLILHGTDDDVVAVRHAEMTDSLAKAIGAKSELHIFEGAQHSYNVRNVMKKRAANKIATEKSWDLTLQFLK